MKTQEQRQVEVLQLLVGQHLEKRRSLQLPLMQPNIELLKAARWMSEHMSNFAFMSHVDKLNRGVVQRVKEETEFYPEYISENLAATSKKPPAYL